VIRDFIRDALLRWRLRNVEFVPVIRPEILDELRPIHIGRGIYDWSNEPDGGVG
jgi:hypothetical protein